MIGPVDLALSAQFGLSLTLCGMPRKALMSLNNSATDGISSGEEAVSLSRSFEHLAHLLARAEHIGQVRETDSEPRGFKPRRRIKKRRMCDLTGNGRVAKALGCAESKSLTSYCYR